MTRSQIKRRFCQFRRSYAVLDLRCPISVRAHEYERKHRTHGVRSVF